MYGKALFLSQVSHDASPELLLLISCLLVVSGCVPLWIHAKNDPVCI